MSQITKILGSFLYVDFVIHHQPDCQAGVSSLNGDSGFLFLKTMRWCLTIKGGDTISPCNQTTKLPNKAKIPLLDLRQRKGFEDDLMIFSQKFGDHNKDPSRCRILLYTDFDLELRPDFTISFNRKQMVRDVKFRRKKGSTCCVSSSSTKLLGHLLEESLQATCHVAV